VPIDGSGKYLVPGHLDTHARPLELKDPAGALAPAGGTLE
jgi:hypothetical protein